MKNFVLIGAFSFVIGTTAAHAEVVIAEGQGNPENHACMVAKRDAERMASNKRKEVVQFGSCSCSYNSAYSLWYCTVEAVLGDKRKPDQKR